MGKILESEFRKELYKNLVDAGYTKQEAQVIVGKKYYTKLHEEVKHTVDLFLNDLVKENFDTSLNIEDINGKVGELKKLQELLNKKEEKE